MAFHAIIACLLAAPLEKGFELVDSSGMLHPCVPGTIVVGLTGQARECISVGGEDEVRAWFAAGGATLTGLCPTLGIARVEIRAGEDVAGACRRLSSLQEVRYAEPDWIGEGAYVPSDPLYPLQWQHNEPRDHDIDTPEAWEINRGSEEVIVAVLDSGILFNHPDFQGRLLAGWDFVNDDDNPTADHPHGVFVAGILAANAGNGFGVAGVDHRCRILPIKVLDMEILGDEFSLVQGLTLAADRGARVISMSLINFEESSALKEALQYARDHGVVLVAAAGNRGIGNADISWPGASPLCISTGATDVDDLVAYFSGTGRALDVVAPGVSVATVTADPLLDVIRYFGGTSASTPIVAGIASLLLSAEPSLTPQEVQDLIQSGAEDGVGGAADLPGWDQTYGWGRVNARRSLELIRKRLVRGDANGDREVDISDALFELYHLFISNEPIPCADAGDVNDDGQVDITDPIAVLEFLFREGSLPPPFPGCGTDTTPDALGCDVGCSR
jgi:subtilisin family serine protease